MLEMHLRQPKFTYSAFEEYQSLKKKGFTICLSKQKRTRRTDSDKLLRDKVFNITKNPKYDGYQRLLASVTYKFLDKKASGISIQMRICQSSF